MSEKVSDIMIPVKDINLQEFILNQVNEHANRLLNKYRKYGTTHVQFEKSRSTNGYLTFLKNEYIEKPNSYYLTIIENWISDVKTQDDEFLYVRIFGNGLSFMIFKDLCVELENFEDDD
jgi:hypothetical protein